MKVKFIDDHHSHLLRFIFLFALLLYECQLGLVVGYIPFGISDLPSVIIEVPGPGPFQVFLLPFKLLSVLIFFLRCSL